MDPNTYWLSYTRHECPGGVSPFPSTSCMVSVVLDDHARYNFSAIRLLILYNQSDRLHDISIKDCRDTRRHFFPASGPGTSYRTRLSLCRAASQSSTLALAAPAPDLPVCTVVLELIDTNKDSDDSSIHIVTLIPQSQSSLNMNIPVLRVAYDRVHRIDPVNPSLLVFLDSNYGFDQVPQELCVTSYQSAISALSVRILPTTRRHKSRVPSQPDIIHRIVDLAVGDKPIGWRSALLAYGLVCKSWAHVLDIFFERFDGTYGRERVDPLTVARSLEARPERGALMKTLDVRYYKLSLEANKGPTSDRDIDGWNAFLKVLRHATSVTEVYLWTAPQSSRDQLVHHLSDLRKVRKCILSENTLTMAEIQTFIAKWEDLYKLEIYGWAHPHDPEHATGRLACNVEDLTLLFGIIRGPQLLHFVSSPQPCLKLLRLEDVQGLSNHDFRLFLSSAAPTLRQVSILNCFMPCSSPDEELALDALMPALINLEHLSATGAHVSALAISRKASITPSPRFRPYTSISIGTSSEGMTLAQVAEAIEVTGWSSVVIRWKGVSEWDESLEERAVSVAKERGVELQCWTGH